MSRTLRIHHPKQHFEDKNVSLSELIVDTAYILGFLVLLGLMLMPYLSRFF